MEDTSSAGATHQASSVNSRRQLLQNTAAGVAGMLTTMVVGLAYARFAYNRLGVELYGVVPVVSNLTTYMTTVTISVAGLAGRDIAAQVARGDLHQANQQFNTFFRVSAAIAAGLFVLCLAFAALLPYAISVPPGQERATQGLFLAVALSFLLAVVAMAFDGAVWARNRLDLRSGIEIGALVIRNGLGAAMLAYFPPALWPIGVAVITAALFSSSASILVSRKLMPSLRLQRGVLDRSLLSSIWESSRWLFITQLTALLFINVDLLMVNSFYGTRASGFYSPIVMWGVIVRGLSTSAIGVLGPPIVAIFAQRDPARLTHAISRSVRFLALGIGLCAAMLAGFSEPLLTLWLGEAFRESAPLAWILLLPIVIEAAAGPLSIVIVAASRFKAAAAAGLGCAVLAVALAALFSRGFGWGPMGVAAGVSIASLIRNGLIAWKLAGDLLQTRWRHAFGRPCLIQFAFCLVVAAAGHLLCRRLEIHTIGGVLLGGSTIALAACGLAWALLLNADDRAELMTTARRVLPGA